MASIDHKAKERQIKSKVETQISKEIKFGLYRQLKLIRGPTVEKQATHEVFDLINYNIMTGPDVNANNAYKAQWIKNFQSSVVRLFNKHRQYVTQQLRTVGHSYWRSHSGTLPTKAQLEALISRNFDPNDVEMMALFKWWWDIVLPKAVGNTKDWAPEKRYFGCISTHHHPSDKKKKYITPATEAYAVWVFESNLECWPAEFKAVDDYEGDQEEVPKMKKLVYKPGTKIPFTMEESKVRHFACLAHHCLMFAPYFVLSVAC